MKKVIVFVVVLVLSGALVFAGAKGLGKGHMPPVEYLESRGLVVLSENQISAAFGKSYIGDGVFFEWFPDKTFSVFTNVDNRTIPMILFKDGNTIYVALEKSIMEVGYSISEASVCAIYADFCQEYAFDIMMASNDGYSLDMCAGDADTLDDLEGFFSTQCPDNSSLYGNKGTFINDVRNYTW